VLDDEPVDEIMRKFEELERFERELAEKREPAPETSHANQWSENDLEELFKRTSNYTVKAAVDPLQAVASAVMLMDPEADDESDSEEMYIPRQRSR